MDKSEKELPAPVRRRLVQLLSILDMSEEERITSSAVSGMTGWSSSQIRHDLWLAGISGGKSNGYDAAVLRNVLRRAVGFGEEKRLCCVVGLGRLGAALLDGRFFDDAAFSLTAGFDSNVNRVEILRSTFPLYPAARIEQVVPELGIEYAVLTLRAADVPVYVRRLAGCGIKGIVNMTSAVVRAPEGVRIENISLANSLMNLLI